MRTRTPTPTLQTGSDSTQQITAEIRVGSNLSGQRLDQIAALTWPEFSRNQLQLWIKQGCLQVDGAAMKASQRLLGGEQLRLQATLEKHAEHQAEAIPLRLLYEDEHLLVVDKPPGLVVHPAAGNWSGTLVNALLHYDSKLELLPRAGIVHRLDKETSGALLVARQPEARQRLVDALQERLIQRQYLALVWGRAPLQASVDAPIGRHPRERKRMAVVNSGKPARTHLSRERQWQHASRLRAQLESGRTHQIRVHCAHLGFPLVGDPVYGRRHLAKDLAPALVALLNRFPRQALHAFRLAFTHPISGAEVALESPIPADLAELIECFERHDKKE